MPSNWKQRSKVNKGKLSSTQIERRRVRTNTHAAILAIRATGQYRGKARVSALRYERISTGGGWRPVNWVDELIREGIISQEQISYNGEYPDRPIQLYLVGSHEDKKQDAGKLKSYIKSLKIGIPHCSD